MDYKITPAQESDMMEIFELANDPLVRQNSFNQNKIEIEGHKKWFSSALENENCFFYIIRNGTDLIGSVRFDSEKENQFVIGVQIAEKYRGKGLASRIISDTSAKLLDARSGTKISAHIKKNNVGSLKAFLKSGYKVIEESQFYILEYENRQ